MNEALDFWYAARPAGRDLLLSALRAFGSEDFSVRLPGYLDGIDEELLQAFNTAAATNERHARQARQLAEGMQALERDRAALEQARAALEDKARQLDLSASFKSEFLANMSHELRTPLNSMLILARLLADNVGGNLSAKQIDYAQTIYSAGTDLLALIDDILDLAKIESGTVILNIEPESLADLRDYVQRNFQQMAQNKGLDFQVELAPGLPAAIRTDGKRLQQILKNLLSNAFKFTRQGRVTLRVVPVPGRGGKAGERLSFAVSDTGIGIPENKQRLIFEAFQQADGSTSREYGGTGLGLSICRELSRLLGGEIGVSSRLGEGSCFTLQLPVSFEPVGRADEAGLLPPRLPDPVEFVPTPAAVPTGQPAPAGNPEERRRGGFVRQPTYYGRKSRSSDDGVVLIAEGDARLASVMLGLVRDGGCQGVVATDSGVMRVLLRELKPDAVILGTQLTDADGWSVFESLRQDPDTRLLPVSITSVRQQALACLQLAGAAGLPACEGASQPERTLTRLGIAAGRDIRRLLLAAGPGGLGPEGERAWQLAGIETRFCMNAADVMPLLLEGGFDALILGDGLGDAGGGLIRQLMDNNGLTELPVALLPGPGMGDEAVIAMLRHRGRFEDVLEDTAHFLEHSIGSLPLARHATPLGRRRASAELAGRKVLIVDDDVRNIYAMTGALEQHGMVVVHAENGREGIDTLNAHPDMDLVLMDIMMPELDGYDTIRIIREQEAFRTLPIIAVTAKAMQGDRQKCLQAGASDYISKPVNMEHLLSLMRVWLQKER